MNNQGALNKVKIGHYFTEGVEERIIEALEKQIPKQPNYTYDEYYECDNCYSELKQVEKWVNGEKILSNPKCCIECGQTIEWD